MRKLSMIKLIKSLFLILCLILGYGDMGACTSLVCDGRATASGRPMLWKHRDTGAPSNFLALVEAPDSCTLSFVGLFNAGDSLLSEAWAGMNEAGFAIMNTASYNIAPDTTDYKDREAIVMSLALRSCRNVEDFAALLEALPRPMGVQANFGVIDSRGNAAYFETWDTGFVRYDSSDTPDGLIVRTNYSECGTLDEEARGQVRYLTAREWVDEKLPAGLSPKFLTDTVSRSFRHALMGCDVLDTELAAVPDEDFIPRRISTASIAVEACLPGENPREKMRMRAILGYPPCGRAYEVRLDDIPVDCTPLPGVWDAPAANEANKGRDEVFHLHYPGTPAPYIDLNIVRKYRNEIED